jgi:Pin2-interacting protein X1
MAYALDLCGSKLRSKLASTLNEASAEPRSTTSFAAKQMEKMGWKEGTGLGKKRDGITTHIKVQKREESSGLGIEKERTRKMGVEGMWWASNVGNTLFKLQKSKKKKKDSKKDKKKKKKKSKKSSPDKPKIYTDEDLFKATGGARFGMRAQSRAEGKWKRTESSSELKEWEDQLKDKIEWNGLGKAKILLKQNDEGASRKRKRSRIVDDERQEKEVEEKRTQNVDNKEPNNERDTDLNNTKKKKKLKKKKKRKIEEAEK